MRLSIIILCLVAINSIQMIIRLQQDQQKCFYQQLSLRQKYAVNISSFTKGDFQLDIKHLNTNRNQWMHSVNRITQENSSEIIIHKLASHQTTYSFCIINPSYEKLSLRVNIKWGLQLLDMNVLAQQDDQKVLEEYSKWIDEQSDTIIKIVDTVDNRRALKQQLKNVLTYKFIIFAIIGILLVVIINFYFYSSMKRALRQRKMI